MGPEQGAAELQPRRWAWWWSSCHPPAPSARNQRLRAAQRTRRPRLRKAVAVAVAVVAAAQASVAADSQLVAVAVAVAAAVAVASQLAVSAVFAAVVMVANFAWLPYYPIWSVIVIAICIAVISLGLVFFLTFLLLISEGALLRAACNVILRTWHLRLE